MHAAISLAIRGLPVFPARRDAKAPVWGAWQTMATDDELAVAKLWRASPGLNIGVRTGEAPNGRHLVVIDFDTYKHKGADSVLGRVRETLGGRGTFEVSTPSGGVHLYFWSSEPVASINDKDRGIDVKAKGGLVIGPGSEFEHDNPTRNVRKGAYRVVNAAPIADLPASVRDIIGTLKAAPKPVASGETAAGEDTPEAIAACTEYLKTAAPAIEGEHGDNRTYAVAARAFDFIRDPVTVLDLMLEHFNPRCLPPWDDADLEIKVRSAFKNRQNPLGVSAHLAPDMPLIQPFTDAPAPEGDLFPCMPCDASDLADIPRRPWVLADKLLRGAVSVLVSPGATGKSLITIQWAMAIILGAPFAERVGLDVQAQGSVILVNLEDDVQEMKRRIAAAARHFSLSAEDLKRVKAGLRIWSGARSAFSLVGPDPQTRQLAAKPLVAKLSNKVREVGATAVILDTFSKIHSGREKENEDMTAVMLVLEDVAQQTNAAVCVTHHTRKPEGSSGDGLAGNQDTVRGASAIVNCARVVLTLSTMTETEATKYGVPEDERLNYVAVADAKPNYGPRGGGSWHRKVPVKLDNGETSVAIEKATLTLQQVGGADLSEIAYVLLTAGQDELSLQAAAEAIHAAKVKARGSSVTYWRKQLPKIFAYGPLHAGGSKIAMEGAKVVISKRIQQENHDSV